MLGHIEYVAPPPPNSPPQLALFCLGTLQTPSSVRQSKEEEKCFGQKFGFLSFQKNENFEIHPREISINYFFNG